MSHFLGFGTALPEHRLGPEESLAALSRIWPHLRGVKPVPVTRFTVQPPEQVFRPAGFGARLEVYAQAAPRLAEEAARRALEASAVSASEVDLVVSVSCTGYLVPALDVHLCNRLGLRSDVVRVPLTELGCAGGAAAIALAHRHLQQGGQQQVALVVCVELCSLTFQPEDRSLDNLTAAMVFGDGAVATVLGAGQGGLEVVATGTRLVPASQDLLGFDLRQDGFHPVLDRGLPQALEGELGGAVADFLGGGAKVDFYAIHAGGPRIFAAAEAALQLPATALELSRRVFAATGNLSSGSLLAVLAELPSGPAGEGLALAFGPGVSIEMARLRRCPG
ncbi:MAG: type III polyketide synthase [Candidatus Dormibacteria bacterium]